MHDVVGSAPTCMWMGVSQRSATRLALPVAHDDDSSRQDSCALQERRRLQRERCSEQLASALSSAVRLRSRCARRICGSSRLRGRLRGRRKRVAKCFIPKHLALTSFSPGRARGRKPPCGRTGQPTTAAALHDARATGCARPQQNERRGSCKHHCIWQLTAHLLPARTVIRHTGRGRDACAVRTFVLLELTKKRTTLPSRPPRSCCGMMSRYGQGQGQQPVLLPPGPGMLQGQQPGGYGQGMQGPGFSSAGGAGGWQSAGQQGQQGGGYGYVPQGMQQHPQGGGYASGRMAGISGPTVARSLGTLHGGSNSPKMHLFQKTLRDMITGMRQHKNPSDQQRFLHKCMAEMRDEVRRPHSRAASLAGLVLLGAAAGARVRPASVWEANTSAADSDRSSPPTFAQRRWRWRRWRTYTCWAMTCAGQPSMWWRCAR